MSLAEAKRILIDYAKKKIKEIESLDMGVQPYCFEEKKDMEKLIEILIDGGIY